MIPTNFPMLGAEVSTPTNAANAAASAHQSPQHQSSKTSGDQFAKALDKASSNNAESKTTPKDTKSSKVSSAEESSPRSPEETASTDETESKPVDEKSETPVAGEEGAAEPATEPADLVAPAPIKPVDVSTLTPLLAAPAAPTADLATASGSIAVPVVVDPTILATQANGVAAPVVEAPTTPLTATLVTTNAKPAEATVITTAPVVVDPIATETIDPATTLPTAGAATDAETPALPATPVAITEAPKEAAPKHVAQTVDPNLANSVNGLNKVEAMNSLTAASAAKAVTQNPNAEPYRQIVQVVHPLRGRDGDHTLTIALNPEHLGRVEVQINIQSNNISMQMNADNPQSRQMLRDSMNELRNALNESGMNAGALDVSSQDAGQQSQQSANARARSWDSSDDIEISDEEFFARLATTSGSAPIGDGPLDIRA